MSTLKGRPIQVISDGREQLTKDIEQNILKGYQTISDVQYLGEGFFCAGMQMNHVMKPRSEAFKMTAEMIRGAN